MINENSNERLHLYEAVFFLYTGKKKWGEEMSVMIFTLVLCGLALEAFRLSVAAGAIQANLTKRKMIWLGGIFAAVQLFLFLLGTGFLWKWIDFLSISGNMDHMARIGSVIFAILGFVMIFLGIREKRLEESCVHPWSVEGFAKYAFKHGMMFLCVGCAAVYCLRRTFWYGAEIFLILFLASVVGLAYGYWQGIRGWRKIRIVTGCVWIIAAVCLWTI